MGTKAAGDEAEASKEVDTAKAATLKAKDGKHFKELKEKLAIVQNAEKVKKTAFKTAKEKTAKQKKSLTAKESQLARQLESAQQASRNLKQEEKDARKSLAEAKAQVLEDMKAEVAKEISAKKQDYSKTEQRLKTTVASWEQKIAKSASR